jgi:hypothetical protein
MEHGRAFGLEHLTPFGRIGQFEDEALARLGLEEDVLVALRRKVERRGPNVVQLLGDSARLG